MSVPNYETVAASQTGQVLGLNGAQGDFIERLIIRPATTSPGLVTILDGSTSIPIMVAGTTTIAPIVVELNMYSVSGAWSVTTGTNVSVIAVGRFTRSATV
jgi:hypothetical protein